MQVKQHGISGIFALDKHPLFHTVDIDKHFLRNAACQWLALVIDKGKRFAGTPGQQYTHKQENTSQ
jgi:hypothetical protein